MLRSETLASVTVFHTECVNGRMPQWSACLMVSNNVSHDICTMMQPFTCHHLFPLPLWTFMLRNGDCPQGAQRAPELTDDLNLALNHFTILSYTSCTIWKLKYLFPPKEIKVGPRYFAAKEQGRVISHFTYESKLGSINLSLSWVWESFLNCISRLP